MALAELRAAAPPDRTGADTPSTQALSQVFGDDVSSKPSEVLLISTMRNRRPRLKHGIRVRLAKSRTTSSPTRKRQSPFVWRRHSSCSPEIRRHSLQSIENS